MALYIGGVAVDATAAEIDVLDGLDRGSIIYGNASSVTTVLGQGGADEVLTSDGTDIAWAAVAGGGGGISHDGSTADGVLTYKDADEATVEANLTFDGSTLIVGSSVGETRIGQRLAVTAHGGTDRGGMTINSFFASDNGPLFDFNKGRNNTAGSHTVVQDGDNLGAFIWRGDDGDEFVDSAGIGAKVDGSPGDNSMPGQLFFYTSPGAAGLTERMTILQDGNVSIGTSTSAAPLHVYGSITNTIAQFTNAHGSDPRGILFMNMTGTAPDNSGPQFFLYAEDTGGQRFTVWSNGNVVNHDNSYGQTSDERIKTDIRDANSQWDDIKGLRVRNFKRKDDVFQYGDNAWEQIGLVAQETEQVSPYLVEHSPPSEFEMEHCGFGEQDEDGEWVVKKDESGKDMQVKSMKYSILYMKAVKALQEAMERIEGLETKVEALENE